MKRLDISRFLFPFSFFLISLGTRAQVIDWVNLPGSPKADIAEDIIVDAEGNSYITGKFTLDFEIGDTILYAVLREDFFVAKFDPNGQLLWARSAGGPNDDVGVEIGLDAAGSVYVGGRFQGSITVDTTTYLGKGNVDIFVVKYDTDGNLQWFKTFGGTRDDRCRGLAVDAAGYTYFSGRFRLGTLMDTIILTAVGEEDVYITKLDLDGSVMWSTSFGGIRKDFGEDIAVAPDGSIYVTGSYFQFINFPGGVTHFSLGDEEIFLAKYDNDGNYVWSQTMGSSERDYGESMICDEYGNVLVSGAFSGTSYFGDKTLVSQGAMDMFLIKVDPDGEVLWAFGAGAPINNDVAWAVSYDGRGNSFLTGWYKGLMTFGDTSILGFNSYNVFVGKINAAGKPTWVSKIGNTNSQDIGRGISCDAEGNAYVGGGYMGTATYGTVTATARGNFDVLHAKMLAGKDDCAFSHAKLGNPTDCSPGDTTYEISVTLYHYFAPDSGMLSVNGQLFPIGGNEQTVLLTNQSSVGGFKDLEVFFTADSTCSYFKPNAYLTPASCDPCIIDSISVVSIGDCKIASNRYTARLSVAYTFGPSEGFLVVNGQEFPVSPSPMIVDLLGLYSFGLPVDVEASFTEDPFCTYSAPALFTAPDTCSTCRISGIVLNDVGACNPLDSTYEVELGLGFRSWPPDGGVFVNGQLFEVSTPPMDILLTGLDPNSLPVNVNVYFENEPTCSKNFNNVFVAPAPCDTCAIVEVELSTILRCNPVELVYAAELQITYANEPDSGSLYVNGQLFEITGSPQLIVLEDLTIDGLPVLVDVYFSARPACALMDYPAFTAPDTCLDCLITGIEFIDFSGVCDPFSNTVSAELQISYLNPPVGGNLLVNSQAFPIGSSPQSVIFSGLPADSSSKDFTAFFANDVVCSLVETDVLTTPAPCDTCGVPTNLQHSFNPSFPNTVLLNWDGVSNATGYVVRGRRMPSGAFAFVASNSTSKLVNNLVSGKTYGYSVTAQCPFDTSVFSYEAYFTMPVAKIIGVEGSLGEQLSIFPNPSSGPTHVFLQGESEAEVFLSLMNLQGAVLYQANEPGVIGQTSIPLDFSHLAQGMYLIEVRQGEESGVLRVQISR